MEKEERGHYKTEQRREVGVSYFIAWVDVGKGQGGACHNLVDKPLKNSALLAELPARALELV